MALYALDGREPQTPDNDMFWVADTAVVIGHVALHEDTSVWFNAVLRGDNEPIEVGPRSNIQESCVLHVDPGFPINIGADCTIGHKVMLHGCTIGRGSLIGMGVTVLNGAVIGEQCLIGAGALVTEGKQIPPRSLVLGAPGKVVRELADADFAMLQRAADSYCARWRQFKSGLKRL
ncbi:MAG: gamma carbonic anhydrase family protein [Pseudomonadota bacterium]